MGETRATVLIKPTTMACPGHGEHLRAQWPKGFAIFSMTIVEALFKDEDFMRACGWSQDSPADTEKINVVLAKRPACYFVGRDVLRQALMEAEIGSIGLCCICGVSGIGGPYSVDVMGKIVEHNHVCFECALNTGERIHAAHPKGGVWHDEGGT